MRKLPLLALVTLAIPAMMSCQDSLATEPARNISASLLQDISVPGGVTLEPFARSAFPHDIDAKFKLRLGRGRHVVHLDDASDVIAARLTIAEGGSVGWHVHPGVAIGIVAAGTFGVIEAHDCELRHYSAGEAFLHLGQGHVDVGFNAGDGDVVVYLTFIGVPAGQPPTVPVPAADAPC